MSGITLTASMRSNLLSLQNTQSLMDMTQERLSTGNKVNSAIDNPSSYYTAQSLNNRAGDLSSLLDSMGQAIQTIKAADQAIESITSFAEQAKAVANSALDSANMEEIEAYQKQFNDIRTQITQLAGDSSYKGVNLLAGDDLTVTFNEGRTSSITVKGEKADAESLNVGQASTWDDKGTSAAAETTLKAKQNLTKAANDAVTAALEDVEEAKAGTVGTEDGDMFETEEAKETAITDAEEVYANAVEAAETAKANEAAAQAEYEAAVKVDIKANKEAISTSIEEVEKAINTLRSMASTFGNNYSIVQNRQEFTENLIDVLTEGADKLTLADMNEESANMLALQTRQQLAINSLSLASQASQSVLKLF